MFKKSAAALRAQALATETKAEKAIAKAQADQIKAVKQRALADKAEVEEKIAQLERDATASHVLYVQSCNARDVAVNECKKAEALLEAAKIRLSAAEEARQKASANYSTARNRVSTLKQTLKKAE